MGGITVAIRAYLSCGTEPKNDIYLNVYRPLLFVWLLVSRVRIVHLKNSAEYYLLLSDTFKQLWDVFTSNSTQINKRGIKAPDSAPVMVAGVRLKISHSCRATRPTGHSIFIGVVFIIIIIAAVPLRFAQET